MRSRLPETYTRRLTPLKYHPVQKEIMDDTFTIQHRFTITHSGRRSGKTEIVGKRRFIARVIKGDGLPNPRYFVAAPTRDQVWRLYWQDLKVMTAPFQNPNRPPRESKLIIYLKGDREIHLLGMDKPERIEGSPWSGGVLDEYANMKKETWEAHVRPALSTPGRPPAWCDFVGVPEGRNHYYHLTQYAKGQKIEFGYESAWTTYHWNSEDILDPAEILLAKSELDELTYNQEYCGDFVSFSGRAYYNFTADSHCAKLHYSPRNDLVFCFDFNVDPGIAVIIQEQNLVDTKTQIPLVNTLSTGIIGEVHIPKNSNTVKVCEKLVQDWGEHQGKVFIYGDASGGDRGSAKVKGSDWDLVLEVLRPVFGERLYFKVPKRNPSIRARINSVNSRCKSTLGDIRLQVDPIRAPNVVNDFEGVTLIDGGIGEIDKKADETLSHLTDAIGYYLVREFPVKKPGITVRKVLGF